MGSVVAFIGISAKDKNISDIKLVDLATKVEQDLLNTKNITEIVEMGFLLKKSRLIFEKMIFCVTILRFKKFQWPSVVKAIISLQGLSVVIYKK